MKKHFLFGFLVMFGLISLMSFSQETLSQQPQRVQVQFNPNLALRDREYNGQIPTSDDIFGQLENATLVRVDNGEAIPERCYKNELHVSYASGAITEKVGIYQVKVSVLMNLDCNYTSIENVYDVHKDVEFKIVKSKAPDPSEEQKPKDLKGKYQEKLSTVVLPQQYIWKNGDTQIAGRLGEKRSYAAIYNPDPQNYNDTEVALEVEVLENENMPFPHESTKKWTLTFIKNPSDLILAVYDGGVQIGAEPDGTYKITDGMISLWRATK